MDVSGSAALWFGGSLGLQWVIEGLHRVSQGSRVGFWRGVSQACLVS